VLKMMNKLIFAVCFLAFNIFRIDSKLDNNIVDLNGRIKRSVWASTGSENVFDIHSDLSVEVETQDGSEQTHILEAFKSNLNEDIIQARNRDRYSELAWYSIGCPNLIAFPAKQKPTTNALNQTQTLINFNRNGFFILVEMLNKEHKKLFVQEVKRKYAIDVSDKQINNLIPHTFKCTLEIDCAEFGAGLYTIEGQVDQLRRVSKRITSRKSFLR
jgi:hypothetical protein